MELLLNAIKIYGIVSLSLTITSIVFWFIEKEISKKLFKFGLSMVFSPFVGVLFLIIAILMPLLLPISVLFSDEKQRQDL